MMRKHPTTTGFTLLEIMVVIALVGVIVGMSVPRMTSWSTKLKARGTARAVADVLNYARGQAIRTGDQHIIFLRVPGVGTTDPNTTDLVDGAGNDVDVLTLRDANGDCLIDGNEIQTFLTFEGDVQFGLTNAAAKVPADSSTAALSTGATFADPENTAASRRWVMFRPDGIPVSFSGDPTGCDTIGATGSGAGGIYMTNGVDDFAPVMTALGGVRLHTYNRNTNAWTN